MDAAGIQRSKKQRKGAAATQTVHYMNGGKKPYFSPNVCYGLSAFLVCAGSPKINFVSCLYLAALIRFDPL